MRFFLNNQSLVKAIMKGGDEMESAISYIYYRTNCKKKH